MNSKISFFNKSVFRSDFKRFGWVSALNVLAIFVFFTAPYLERVFDGFIRFQKMYIYSELYQMSLPSMTFIFIVPVALATLLFAYLNTSNSATCLHGLPIKRKTYYMSHMAAGSVLLILPVLINLLILLLCRVNTNVAASSTVSQMFTWAGLYLLYTMLVFSFTAVVAMITGNSVATLILTYIFGVLPFVAELFIKFFCEQQLYGYSMREHNYIGEFLYIFPSEMMAHPLNILKYLIFIAILAVGGYFIYKKRKLENSSEVVAFPKLKPVFVYGVALCAGAAGYAYFYALWNLGNILLLIPFGVLGLVIAEMIVKKTLKIKTVYKPAITFCIGVFILFLGFQFDILGFERKVPALDTISAVAVDNGANAGYTRYSTNGKVIYYDEHDSDFTSPEDVQKVITLHNTLIQDKNVSLSGDEWAMRVSINYKLKNGKTLMRSYVTGYQSRTDVLRPIIESTQMRERYFPILVENDKKIISVEVRDVRKNNGAFELFDRGDRERILSALREDTQSSSYDNYAERRSELTNIDIIYTRPAKYHDGTAVPENLLPTIHETYYIHDDYVRTKALLAELGFYDTLIKAEDIKLIRLYREGRSQRIEEGYNGYQEITDREEIAAIYEEFQKRYKSNRNDYAEFELFNGNSFSI